MRPAKSAVVAALEDALEAARKQEEDLRKGNEARAVLRDTMRGLSKLERKVGKQRLYVVRKRRAKRANG